MKKFLSEKLVRAQLAAVDMSQVQSGSLRKRLAKFRNKQGGFTLLELLVVVAILAAIASTATIMLQDTDRKAAAATHVAVMDELTKGIATWRVLHQAQYPNVYESLIENATNTTTGGTLIGELDGGLTPFITATALTGDQADSLINVGITDLRVIDPAALAPGGAAGSCADSTARTAAIQDKKNDFVNSNLFRAPNAASDRGGCGYAANYVLAPATAATVAVWNATENYRVNANANDTVIALGLGPDNTLFKIDNLGAMSSTPLYRHVDAVTYNHFIMLLNLGDWTGTNTGKEPQLQAIIDASGDTRDEELGEFDGTRSTL